MYNRTTNKKHYAGSDFTGEICYPETINEAIDCKVNLLKDFGFLRRKEDEREPIIRAILGQCKTANEIDNLLHKVVRYDETLDEFIARKGVQNV